MPEISLPKTNTPEDDDRAAVRTTLSKIEDIRERQEHMAQLANAQVRVLYQSFGILTIDDEVISRRIFVTLCTESHGNWCLLILIKCG